MSSQTSPLALERRTGANLRVFSPNHLPSLDGLRAVSIALVLIAHGADAVGSQSDFAGYLGQLGVSTFLVISGALITWLLICERDETGSVSLRNFYIRRALRILPAFWFFGLTVIALKWMHVLSIGTMDILRAFTFTHNYPPAGHGPYYAWAMAHTWSLSLEEQFYVLWPGLFCLLSKKKAFYVTLTTAISGPILRVASYYLLPFWRGQDGRMFQTRIDILMMGCLIAFLLNSPDWKRRIRQVQAGPAILASAVFLFVILPALLGSIESHTVASAVFSATMPTLQAIAIAAAVLLLVAGKPGHTWAALNHPAVSFVGQRSYSLYLWQQLFLWPVVARDQLLLWRGTALTAQALIGHLGAAWVTSLLSFWLLEKPLLKLRRKFRRVALEVTAQSPPDPC